MPQAITTLGRQALRALQRRSLEPRSRAAPPLNAIETIELLARVDEDLALLRDAFVLVGFLRMLGRLPDEAQRLADSLDAALVYGLSPAGSRFRIDVVREVAERLPDDLVQRAVIEYRARKGAQ